MGSPMSTTREELLRTAMELSESDRLLLATELLETVSETLPGFSRNDPELINEIETRMNDGSASISWEAVREQLRADLKS